MFILQLVAHPDTSGSSFTSQLADKFIEGAFETHPSAFATIVNVFDQYDSTELKNQVRHADHLCLAFPLWWEMPPAKMVEVLQTVFIRGFAFESTGDRMAPLLNLRTTCLISMGRENQYNTTNLHEAMAYCGLHPEFLLFNNVGPRLTPELAEVYLDVAYRHGESI